MTKISLSEVMGIADKKARALGFQLVIPPLEVGKLVEAAESAETTADAVAIVERMVASLDSDEPEFGGELKAI